MKDDKIRLAKIRGQGTNSIWISARSGTTTSPASRPVDA